jgi:BMFP domain-containing protein YqiC
LYKSNGDSKIRFMTDDKDHNLVLDILKQLQEGQKAIKQSLRTEFGSVRAELQIIQQQLTTSHNMTVHQRNELSRLEDRIARLEAHTGIEDSPQHGYPFKAGHSVT